MKTMNINLFESYTNRNFRMKFICNLTWKMKFLVVSHIINIFIEIILWHKVM